jgi:hypothetical protein
MNNRQMYIDLSRAEYTVAMYKYFYKPINRHKKIGSASINQKSYLTSLLQEKLGFPNHYFKCEAEIYSIDFLECQEILRVVVQIPDKQDYVI